jgi:hypothetical protein
MARLIFPDEGSRTVQAVDASGRFVSVKGTSFLVFTDAAGTVLADLRDAAGAVLPTASTLTLDPYSRIPLFQGPSDGTDTLYVSINSGPITPVYARQDDRIDALNTTVAGLPSSASVTAAVAAEATARAAADAAEATARTTAATAALAAANATYATLAATPAKPLPGIARVSRNKFSGLNVRSFTSLGAAATGLTISGGGVIATAIGTTGSMRYRLPSFLDPTKPFRMSLVYTVTGTPDASFADVALTNKTDNNYGVSGRLQSNTGSSVNSGANLSQLCNATATAGQYEFYVISDGTRVTYGIKPLLLGLLDPNGFVSGSSSGITDFGRYAPVQTQTRFDAALTFPANTIDTVIIKSATQGIRINSFWVNIGGITAPESSSGAFSHYPLLSPDSATTLRGRLADGFTPFDLIFNGHPNGSAEAGSANVATTGGNQHANLVDAGFLMAYCRGDAASYTSAASSDWGGITGIAARKAYLDYLIALFPQIRNIYWMGHSMGLVDGLNFHAQYPGIIKGILGFSGVTNLTYSYATEGFSSQINLGHGETSAANVADRDPNLRPEAFTSIPIKLYHGTADALISKVNHADLFATRVNAAGGNVTVVPSTGGGHLDALFWANIPTSDPATFFQGISATLL